MERDCLESDRHIAAYYLVYFKHCYKPDDWGYGLIKDYFIDRMEFSIKVALIDFIGIPTIIVALLYAVCTRNREQYLEMIKNPGAMDELFSKFWAL